MPTAEPTPTAWILATAGVLIGASVLFSRASRRLGVPVALLFIVVGMVAGSEGLGGIFFDDYAFAFRLGTAALTLILFDGGLNTSFSALRLAWKPAGVLATVGVAATAGITALGARAFGFPWEVALLVGAVVSSTDAAAVFSVLRGAGLHLQKRVSTTLELESGFNDPMAVILTFALTETLRSGQPLGLSVLAGVVIQLLVGAALGVGIGFFARWLLGRITLPAAGLYPVLTIAVACFAFGVPTLLQGSGFLAVYTAGIVLGNGDIPYKNGLLRVHDAAGWFSQVAMFLVLGLLVYPSRLIDVAPGALSIALFLAFIGRPLVVVLCLLPFRYSAREIVYAGWVGLRGAVPIVLGAYPVLQGAPGSERIFNVVFFVVLVSVALQGGTVGWLTRKLGLEVPEPPPPPAVLEVQSRTRLNGDILSFYIEGASAVAGSEIRDLPFPEGASVMLVVRGEEVLPARGATQFQPGDHVYVFCRRPDRPFVQLLFGQAENA